MTAKGIEQTHLYVSDLFKKLQKAKIASRKKRKQKTNFSFTLKCFFHSLVYFSREIRFPKRDKHGIFIPKQSAIKQRDIQKTKKMSFRDKRFSKRKARLGYAAFFFLIAFALFGLLLMNSAAVPVDGFLSSFVLEYGGLERVLLKISVSVLFGIMLFYSTSFIISRIKKNNKSIALDEWKTSKTEKEKLFEMSKIQSAIAVNHEKSVGGRRTDVLNELREVYK